MIFIILYDKLFLSLPITNFKSVVRVGETHEICGKLVEIIAKTGLYSTI